MVVCDRGKIVGVPGVSMDELVGICTKLAREMDAQGQSRRRSPPPRRRRI